MGVRQEIYQKQQLVTTHLTSIFVTRLARLKLRRRVLKTSLFCVLVLLTKPSHGIYEFLAKRAHQLAHVPCPPVDPVSTEASLTSLAANCLRPQDFASLSAHKKISLEQSLLSIAAAKNKEHLDCQKDKLLAFTRSLSPAQIADFQRKSLALSELKRELGRATSEFTLHRSRLPRERSWVGGAIAQNAIYQELQQRIQSLSASIQAISSTIPFYNDERVAKAIDLVVNDGGQSLDKSYQEVIGDLRHASLNLSSAMQSKGINRELKEQLMSDPAIVGQLFKDNPEEVDKLAPLICEMDAKYGSGAKLRDAGLLAGSFVLGGVTLKAVSKAGQAVAQGAYSARMTGVLSQPGLRVLQAASIGISSLESFKSAKAACIQDTHGKMANSCDLGSFLAEFEQSNCLLKIALTSLMVEANFGFATKALINHLNTGKIEKGLGHSVDTKELKTALDRMPNPKEPHGFPTTGVEVEMQVPNTVSDKQVGDRIAEAVKRNGGDIIVKGEKKSYVTYEKNGRHNLLELKKDDSVSESVYMRSGELTSPVIHKEDDAESFLESIYALRTLGARPHFSAGLHVHTGTKNLTAAELNAIRVTFNQIENELIFAFRQLPNRQEFAQKLSLSENRSIDKISSVHGNKKVTDLKRDIDDIQIGNFLRLDDEGERALTRGLKNRNLNFRSLFKQNEDFRLAHTLERETLEFRLFNSTLNRNSIEFMRNFSGHFVQAVRNKDSRLVDYYHRLEKGEPFEMRNLTQALGMKYSDKQVDEIMASIAAEAHRMNRERLKDPGEVFKAVGKATTQHLTMLSAMALAISLFGQD